MAVIDGKRHQGRGFVAGVAEHQTLVACTLVQVYAFAFVHALGDVGGLLVVVHADRAAVGIKAQLGRVVADAFDGFACDFDVVHMGGGGDFARQHAQTGVYQSFRRDTRFGVLRQNRIQNRIGHLVGYFVRMAFGNRFGSKQIFAHFNIFLQKQAVCFQTTCCFIIRPTTEIITKFPPVLHPNDKYSYLDKAVRNPARTEHTDKKIPASSGGI